MGADRKIKTQSTVEIARKSLSDALRLSFNVLKIIMGIVLILYLTSGIFVVKQHELGIILRFGRIVSLRGSKVLNPGIHWAWPFPIDEHKNIPAGRTHSLDISFTAGDLERTEEGRRTVSRTLKPKVDRYCLTGDANIIHAKWLVRYRIADPVLYLTKALKPEKVLEVIARNAVLQEVSKLGADEALRTKVDEVRRKVYAAISGELERTKIGLVIQGVDLKEIFPPRQVREAFNSVIEAAQERSQKIHEAEAFQNRLINEATGEAESLRSEANTYRIRVVEEAGADSRYMESLLKQYPDEPQKLMLYLNQIYREVLGETLSQVEERFVIAKGETPEQREIWYIVGPEKD